MYESNRLDIFPRENKTMGAMTYPMKSDGLPLLLASYHRSAPSLTQVIHELGHGMHFFLSRGQALQALMPIPPEVGELIALSFELIALSHNHVFYQDGAARQQIVQSQLYRVFSLLALSMAMDAFQHEVYQNPECSAEERNACWQKHYLRFHGETVTWQPFEEELSHYWLRHYHLFEAPLYSTEYAIAQLGALQLWQQYEQAPEDTIQKLHHVMELGFSKPVKVLYSVLGLDLFPDEKKIKELLSYCLDLFCKKPVEG
jgi:oligoendopeptidase F